MRKSSRRFSGVGGIVSAMETALGWSLFGLGRLSGLMPGLAETGISGISATEGCIFGSKLTLDDASMQVAHWNYDEYTARLAALRRGQSSRNPCRSHPLFPERCIARGGHLRSCRNGACVEAT